jgi:acyl-CoA thioesterase-1
MIIMKRKILALTLWTIVGSCGTDAREGGATTGRPDGPSPARPVVLFLGTSLTAGYGLPIEEAYPNLIARRIDSLGLPFRVVNAGVSGETSAGGLRRIDWLVREPVAVLVLELGANDGLRGLDPAAMARNLQAIVDRTRGAHPEVSIVVAGMEAPPNLGERFTERFRTVFSDLAKRNDAALIPFLLDGVAGDPTLNQADGIHPTADGHRVIATTVWSILEPILTGADAAAVGGGDRQRQDASANPGTRATRQVEGRR